jgi:hypothetical protein
MDDVDVEEVTVTSGHQVVQPIEIQFLIDCVFDPTHPEKPKCRIKFAKQIPDKESDEEDLETDIGMTESVEKESGTDDGSKGNRKRKPDRKKSESEKDDTSDDEDDDENDYEDMNQPILECIAKAYPDSDD